MDKKGKVLPDKDEPYLMVIGVLILLISVSNHMMIIRDNTSMSNDAFNHYLESEAYYNSLSKFDFPDFFERFRAKNHNPPLIRFETLPFYVLLGICPDTAEFSNILNLAILLISTYFIGKYLKGATAGFIGVLMLISIPMTLGFSRVYLDIMAVAALFALSVLFLLYSNWFKNKWSSLLFGISVGIGLLSKVIFVFYIAPLMILYALAYMLSFGIKISRSQMTNIIIAFLLVVFIASPWYMLNYEPVLENAVNTNEYHQTVDFPGLNDWEIISMVGIWYLDLLKNKILYGFSYLVLLAIFYCVVSFRPSNSRIIHYAILLLNIPITFLFFMRYPAMPRYLLPFLFVFTL